MQGWSSLDQGWGRLGDEPVEIGLAEPVHMILSLIIALRQSCREIKVRRAGLLALGEEEVAQEGVLQAIQQRRTRIGNVGWIREGIACKVELVCQGNALETDLDKGGKFTYSQMASNSRGDARLGS